MSAEPEDANFKGESIQNLAPSNMFGAFIISPDDQSEEKDVAEVKVEVDDSSSDEFLGEEGTEKYPEGY